MYFMDVYTKVQLEQKLRQMVANAKTHGFQGFRETRDFENLYKCIESQRSRVQWSRPGNKQASIISDVRTIKRRRSEAVAEITTTSGRFIENRMRTQAIGSYYCGQYSAYIIRRLSGFLISAALRKPRSSLYTTA